MNVWSCFSSASHFDRTLEENFDESLLSQKNLADIVWNWMHFQAACWKSNYMNYNRYIFHTQALLGEPKLLFRYTRRNWQKPFVALAAQNMTHWQLLNLMLLEEIKWAYHLKTDNITTPH